MLNVVVLVSGGGTNLQAIIEMHMHWSVPRNTAFRISAFLQKIMKAVRFSIRNL